MTKYGTELKLTNAWMDCANSRPEWFSQGRLKAMSRSYPACGGVQEITAGGSKTWNCSRVILIETTNCRVERMGALASLERTSLMR